MIRLVTALAFSTVGGTIIIHLLKNFLLKEKSRLSPDWDGIFERLIITYLILSRPDLWPIIPAVILIKILSRTLSLRSSLAIARRNEPGAVPQKVLMKSELAFDLILSPAFALLSGALF